LAKNESKGLKIMRVENWNPNRYDQEFENVAIGRLVEAAEEVAGAARDICPVGTTDRPMYKTGMYAGKEWTKRDGGGLKRSIRVTRLKTQSGKAFSKKRNVRVYAGNYWAYYAQIVEFYTPFMRRALVSSLGAVKAIIGVK
jgi:hypothetical protein